MKALWAPLEETKTGFFKKERGRMEHTRGLLWFLVGWCLEEEDRQIPRPAAKNFLKAREGGPGSLRTGGWGKATPHHTLPACQQTGLGHLQVATNFAP